jgi:hypothetical protein
MFPGSSRILSKMRPMTKMGRLLFPQAGTTLYTRYAGKHQKNTLAAYGKNRENEYHEKTNSQKVPETFHGHGRRPGLGRLPQYDSGRRPQ